MSATPADAYARPIDQLSDDYVKEYARLDPITATLMGVPGSESELPDLSPSGHQQRAELTMRTAAAIRALQPVDAAEATSQAVFLERADCDRALHEAGQHAAALNLIESPPQLVREVFDLMPTGSEQDWAAIADRLHAVPDALGGARESLRHSAASGAPGSIAARRQVRRVIDQCAQWSGQRGPSFFAELVSAAAADDGTAEVPDTLRDRLTEGARQAAAAYAELGTFLETELAPAAPERDAVGEELYKLHSRNFLGSRLDMAEAYEWGCAEFSRVEQEMTEVAARIRPGAGLRGAAEALDADPRYLLHGTPALVEWMQRHSDAALESLSGSHFQLTDRQRTLECRIAPSGGPVGAYYTGPSADFSRPGRMWWAVPEGQTDFPVWQELSTVYHEGVPGHHLQVSTAVEQGGRLNDYRRLMCWSSGHGEGWALYAERLMRELGHLDDDGFYLGMLAAHLFRAARVIVDLGMHMELEIPVELDFHAGQRWSPELAVEFMERRTLMEPVHVRDEVDRYLGWPGQAPSYKLGERLWLRARADAEVRKGAAFDLREFHTGALQLGAMGLDVLDAELAKL